MLGEPGARSRKLLVVWQEPDQDQLADWPSGERLGNREEVAEPPRLGRDDHDRSPARRGRRRLRAQGRVLAKDRLLELVQGRARFDAELVDEELSRFAIDLERFDLTTRAVERPHEYGPQPFAQRVLADEHLELSDELGVTAEREVGFESTLERPKAELFEARNLSLRERLLGEVGKRRPAPKVESFAQPLRRRLGRHPLRLLDEQLEAEQVELVWTDADQVTRLLRDNRLVRSERLAEL